MHLNELVYQLLVGWSNEDKFLDALADAMKSLSEREQFVLKERLGLNGKSPKTLAEVAVILKPDTLHWKGNKQGNEGVTRERVRQIEAKGIRILRHPSHLNAILKSVGLMKYRSPQQIAKDENKTVKQVIGEETIEVLLLPLKVQNILLNGGAETVADVRKLVESSNILKMRHMGMKTYYVILERLTAYYAGEGEVL